MYIFVTIFTVLGVLFLFNWLMGYRKGNITIDFDERYFNQKDYRAAIQKKLESQGRNVYYQGNNLFNIDGHTYLLIERNVSMGGIPLQRTILRREE
ncbi:hypothetical protein [Saliterribacillus persicus]|uniref:Uncharacterized protein n=1 Tax=Saliterribacillus persicus TaxID=930114 RepID=A0A368Y6K0_9BACI|nr:hypothetical protein [Saliterribacillus persicus]RCW74956.1 hypothetical protein DFR57_103253 [Saliterribacillus persicus]